MPTNDDIMDLAQQQDGKDYIFGREDSPKDPDPEAFDCSELVEWVCARENVQPTMPDGAANQLAHCRAHGTLISIGDAMTTKGALLFRISGEGNHVAFSLGNGNTFEARGKDYGVGSWSAKNRTWTHAALIPGVDYHKVPVQQVAPPLNILKPEEIDLARDRIPIFQAAADAYTFPDELKALMEPMLGPNWFMWVLMGIDSRESRFGLLLDEDGLGDHGHGHGELQIDDRSHGPFCDSGEWEDLAASLAYVHKNVIIPSFNYLGNKFDLFGEDYGSLFWATIAAYNCGQGNELKAVEEDDGVPGIGDDIDERTAGHNYSADVRRRALALRGALEKA